jgi:hypothetical protein
MKYIKLFEIWNKTIKEYWKVIYDENINIKLDKLGISEETQLRIYEHYNELIELNCIRKEPFLWLSYDGYEWSWDFNDTGGKSFANAGYNNKGEVEVTEKEIEDWQVNQSAKKYNL